MPTTPPPPDYKPDCPFCAIAATSPPHPTPLPVPTPSPDPPAPASTAHLILSTPQVIAFLDHAPISRGHTLVCVRAHREKLSDVRIEEAGMLGRWLGLVSKSVVGAVKGLEGREGGGIGGGGGGDAGEMDREEGEEVEEEEEDQEVGDWNVVQNNGARAAQVVPHVHFHIIPRVGDVPEVRARSWTVFGRGQREELEEEDAERLVRGIRRRLAREVRRVGEREGEGVVKVLFGGGEDWEKRWSKL